MIGGTSTSSAIIGVKLSDGVALTSTVPQELLEQPGLKKRIMGNGPATPNPSVACNFSCRKFFRQSNKRIILANTDLSGTNTANPAEQAYFITCFAPVISGEDLPAMTFQVEITYIATFTGPKELIAS